MTTRYETVTRELSAAPRKWLVTGCAGFIGSNLLETLPKLGQTVVLVTHDLDEAILLSDRVVVLSGPPSRVLLDERIRIPHPRDVFTVRETPQFVTHVQSLWSVLGQQFRAAA